MRNAIFRILWAFMFFADAIALNLSQLDSKLVGGKTIKDHSKIPFSASIRLFINFNRLHICGGSLITLVHILTAGQCIYQIQKYSKPDLRSANVWLGSPLLNGTARMFNIMHLEHHRNYDPNQPNSTSGYDIGVILLRRKVPVTVAIHPIDILKYKIPFEFGSTVGWGSEEVINVTDTIQLNNSMMSQRIKRINLRILTDFECENLYFERIIGIYHICGLGEKKGEQIAVGDAGNPLIVKYNDVEHVAGVASYVPGRGGVYTSLFVSVHNHLGYIQGAMARLSNITRKYPCFSVSENEDHHIY